VYGLQTGNDLFRLSTLPNATAGALSPAIIPNNTTPSARMAFGMTILNYTIFVYQGIYTAYGFSTPPNLWGYDIKTGNWTQWTISGLQPNATAEMYLTTWNGTIYESFGSIVNSKENRLFSLTPNFANKSVIRTQVATLNPARSRHRALMFNSVLVVLGGADNVFDVW